MFKFRSMHQNAPDLRFEMADLNEIEGPVFKIKNNPCMIWVGKFLRQTSIDELPRLLNIFLCEMSVVGPRSFAHYETVKLNDYQKQHLLVHPGLLCYWQVRGRNNISFDEWMAMNLKYINDTNLWVDFKIILEGIPAVLIRNGAE